MKYHNFKQRFYYQNNRNKYSSREKMFNHSNGVDSIRDVKDIGSLDNDLIIHDSKTSSDYTFLNIPYMEDFILYIYETLINSDDPIETYFDMVRDGLLYKDQSAVSEFLINNLGCMLLSKEDDSEFNKKDCSFPEFNDNHSMGTSELNHIYKIIERFKNYYHDTTGMIDVSDSDSDDLRKEVLANFFTYMKRMLEYVTNDCYYSYHNSLPNNIKSITGLNGSFQLMVTGYKLFVGYYDDKFDESKIKILKEYFHNHCMVDVSKSTISINRDIVYYIESNGYKSKLPLNRYDLKDYNFCSLYDYICYYGDFFEMIQDCRGFKDYIQPQLESIFEKLSIETISNIINNDNYCYISSSIMSSGGIAPNGIEFFSLYSHYYSNYCGDEKDLSVLNTVNICDLSSMNIVISSSSNSISRECFEKDVHNITDCYLHNGLSYSNITHRKAYKKPYKKHRGDFIDIVSKKYDENEISNYINDHTRAFNTIFFSQSFVGDIRLTKLTPYISDEDTAENTKSKIRKYISDNHGSNIAPVEFKTYNTSKPEYVLDYRFSFIYDVMFHENTINNIERLLRACHNIDDCELFIRLDFSLVKFKNHVPSLNKMYNSSEYTINDITEKLKTLNFFLLKITLRTNKTEKNLMNKLKLNGVKPDFIMAHIEHSFWKKC